MLMAGGRAWSALAWAFLALALAPLVAGAGPADDLWRKHQERRNLLLAKAAPSLSHKHRSQDDGSVGARRRSPDKTPPMPRSKSDPLRYHRLYSSEAEGATGQVRILNKLDKLSREIRQLRHSEHKPDAGSDLKSPEEARLQAAPKAGVAAPEHPVMMAPAVPIVGDKKWLPQAVLDSVKPSLTQGASANTTPSSNSAVPSPTAANESTWQPPDPRGQPIASVPSATSTSSVLMPIVVASGTVLVVAAGAGVFFLRRYWWQSA